MKKKIVKNKVHITKLSLAIGASILTLSSVCAITNISSQTNNSNHSASPSTKSQNIETQTSTTSAISKSQTRNTITTVANYSESNPYTTTSFKSQYAYQWASTTSNIQNFVYDNLSVLFSNTRSITKNDIVIQEDLIQMNDQSGYVTVGLYFNAWQSNGELVYTPSQTFTIKFAGFKILPNNYRDPSNPALRTYFKFKNTDINNFPSKVLEELLALNGKTLDANALSILSKYFYFGPIPTEVEDFRFEISGAANNVEGSLSVQLKLNYILATDDNNSYTKLIKSEDFNTKPIIFNTISNNFRKKGISKLKQTVIDVNSIPTLSKKYNVSDFIFDIKNASSFQVSIKTYIASLIEAPVGVTYNSNNVIINTNELTSDTESGIVSIPITITNFYTIDSSEDKTFNFTFLLEPTILPVITKSQSFPILMDVNQAIEKINADLKKNNYEQQTFIRQFLNVLNINFQDTKVTEIRTTSLNSEKNSVSINFKFSNIPSISSDGQVTYGDYWTDSFFFQFYRATKETTILDNIQVTNKNIFDDNPATDVYPFTVANQPNQLFLKEIIVNQGTTNKPGTVNPDGSILVQYDTSNVFIESTHVDNKLGEIVVNGYINKYLTTDTNKNVICINGKLPFTTTISGFKVSQSNTIVSRNPEYIDQYNQMLPSEFIENFNSGAILNNYELVNSLLLIYYHPLISSNGKISPENASKFANTKIKNITGYDNKKGTIDIVFTIDGMFSNDPSFSYTSSTWDTEPIKFNFFKAQKDPTQIFNSIVDNDAIYQKFSAMGAAKSINNYFEFNSGNSNIKPSRDEESLISRIKQIILENLRFLPTNNGTFTVDNISSINVTNYNNDEKWLDLQIEVNYYIDANGNEVTSDSAQKLILNTRLNANFRNVERTEFNTGPFFVPDVQLINASEWLPLNNGVYDITKVVDFLYDAYANNNSPKVLKGDIPEFGTADAISKSDIIITNVVADDRTASVTVEASLKKYWNYDSATGQNKIVSNEAGYQPYTKITFIGFLSPGTTILPLGSEYEVDDSLSSYLPSSFMQTNSEFTKTKLQEFIFGTYGDNGESTSGLITGKKEGMSASDVNILESNSSIFGITYHLEPNDLDGTLIVRGELTQQWYLDYDSGQKIFGQAPVGRREFNFTLTGFNTLNPTNVKTSVMTDQPEIYATDLENNLEAIKNLIATKAITNAPIGNNYNQVSSNKIFEIIGNPVFNNLAGTITVNINLNAWYHKTNSLLYNVENDPNNKPQQYSIVITGFKKSEPTTFIKQNEFQIDQYNNILNNIPQDVDNIIKNHDGTTSNEIIDELKNIVLNDIIATGSMRITLDDIVIESITAGSIKGFDNKNGTLTIKIKLNKYWDSNGNWIENSTQLEKEITLKTFKVAGETKVNEHTYIDVSKSSLLNSLTADTYKEVMDANNTDYVNETMKLIWDNNIYNYNGSYTDRMTFANIVIKDISADLNLGQADVTFVFNRYWNTEYEFIDGQESREFTVKLINFKRVLGTTLLDGIKTLNGKVYNSEGSRFDEGDKTGNEGALQFKPNNNISQITAQQWVDLCAANQSDYITQLKNFIWYNLDEFIINPPKGSEFTIDNIVLSNPNIDNSTGQISMSFTLNKYINGVGQIVNEQMTPVNVVFKQFLAVGETKYTDATEINISEYEPLYNYVTTNKIQVSQLSFSNGSVLVNGEIDPNLMQLLKEFLLEKGLTGYVPKLFDDVNANITSANIDIQNLGDKNDFNRSVSVEFSTNRYYDISGNLINQTLEPKKVLILKGFYPPSGSATILKDATSNISSFVEVENENNITNYFFVDQDTGKGLYYANVASDANTDQKIRELARNNLRKWIFDKVVSGNKEGLTWEDVEIVSGYDQYDVLKGTLTLTYRMKKYWLTSGPTTDPSPIYTVNLSNFKVALPTTSSSNTFDLTNYNGPKKEEFQNILNEIPSKTSAEMLDPSNPSLDQFKLFLNEYIAWNGNTIFENLPDSLQATSQEDFYNAFIDKFQVSSIIADEENSTIVVTIKLHAYVDENGNVVDSDNSSNIYKEFNVTFNGFRTLRPTQIINTFVTIDITKNAKPSSLNYYHQILSTYYGTNMSYDWYNSYPEDLIENIAANSDGIFSLDEAKASFNETIRNWIKTNNIDNPAVSKNETILIDKVNVNNSLGVISINYTLTYGYELNDEGNYVPGNLSKPLKGTIKLVGFRTNPVLNASSITQILTLGGIALGVLCLLIIILVLVYKRKRDIEYRQ